MLAPVSLRSHFRNESGYAPGKKIEHFHAVKNTVSFCMKPPSCATRPPSGDGDHWDTTIQMYWKLSDFSFR